VPIFLRKCDQILHLIVLPKGISVTYPDGTATAQSCIDFCGYHGSYYYRASTSSPYLPVYYAMIPDLADGACPTGCGANPVEVNNLFSVMSHEIIESATDPDVDYHLAWYDDQFGEVGDICNAVQGAVVGGDGLTYVVQAGYSNTSKLCIVERPPLSLPTYVGNGGLESVVTPWLLWNGGGTVVGAWYTNTGAYPAVGSGYVILGVNNAAIGYVYQFFNVPATAVGTLSFYLSVNTQETGGVVYDVLAVQILNSDGTVSKIVATYSNRDSTTTTGVYSKKEFPNVLQPYRNKRIALAFRAQTDASEGTTFRVDQIVVN